MTYRELLAEAVRTLNDAGVAEHENDAWLLFSECFSMSRAMYFLKRAEAVPGGEELDARELFVQSSAFAESGSGNESMPVRFARWVKFRSERIPLQQIVGHQEFMGLDFLVNQHVLIPRQDTEVLVETVLGDLRRTAVTGKAVSETPGVLPILDMCAGSGCIGISLERLASVPVSVLGADISDEALKVAEVNGKRLGCERYRVCKSDLFAQIEGSFDVIVSNPPYIATAVIDTLDTEVKDHEPRLALDGEADGLTFYRRLAVEAPRYLTDGGRIYFEIGYDQGVAVSKLLREAGFLEIRVIRDLAGLDRVVAAVWPGVR